VDTRFAWQHLGQGEISVYWYDQDTAYGQNLLNTAATEATTIEKDLNGTLSAPIRVLVYASNQDLRGGLPADTPNWAGGVAFISLDEALIVVGDAVYPLQRDLPHELTHLIFHEIAGVNCGGCPLWFDEGMAVYHQLYHEPEMQLAFDDAVKSKHLLAFNSIADRFPDDTDQAELAYAQSWNYLKYLYSTYGQPKMAHLVDALAKTTFNTAFQQTFGLSPNQMENQWDASLGVPPANGSSTNSPSTGGDTGSQPAGLPAADNSSNGMLDTLAVIFFLLLFAGLVGMYFIWRRRPAPVPATGAPWPAPYAGAPQPGYPPGTPQPGYSPGVPSGYLPFPPPQGIPAEQRYRWQIEQRQALLRNINEAIAIEKHLELQGADLARQVALYAAQERQAYAEQREDRAMLALDQRRRLEQHLATLQQQFARVRFQRQQDMERERQISAEIDAVFSQQAAAPGASSAWPQPDAQIPAPARRFSQE
ncbi:MAG TPA: peptidase MA family metallohydrolase, partial [Ktedonobacterales bacterium]